MNDYAHLLTYSDKKIISKIIQWSARYKKKIIRRILITKFKFKKIDEGSYKEVFSKDDCNFVVKVYRDQKKEYAQKEKLPEYLQPYVLDALYQSEKIQIQFKAHQDRESLKVIDDFFCKLFGDNNLEYYRNPTDFKVDNYGQINDDVVVVDFWK